ncbi:MAG: glutathione S-transferase [Pseudomonadota bacterium]
MSNPIRIYRHPLSGHSHRVELFASLLGLEYTLQDVDLASGEHQQAAFLALNPAGQVPVIEHNDAHIADANAILVYLGQLFAPDWLGQTPLETAQIQQFLSMAAGEIASGPAAARLITVFGAKLDVERASQVAEIAFKRLETHLQTRRWLVGNRPTIADVAIYSYAAHAPEGNVSLDPYPNTRAWLQRIEALPGFVPMQATRVGLAA